MVYLVVNKNLSSRQVGERDLIVKFSDEAAEQEIYL